jgi:hypothetical protein
MIGVAASSADWTAVTVGAILVLGGGATVLLNRRYRA